MFELMLCSVFTLLPDYLYRRYAQGHVLKMLAVLLKAEMPLPAALAVAA